MANREVKPMTGTATTFDCQTELCTIPPLPFWPSLKWALRSHGAALLLVYLEVHFPAPAASPSDPILVDVDRTLRDLCLCPKALWLASARIAVRWPTARMLRVARQSGREFFTRQTLGAGTLKPYSYVPISAHQWQLRRNMPRLKSLLASCAIPWPIQQPAICEDRYATHFGFQPSCEHFPSETVPETGSELARAFDKSLAGLSDGRRVAGLKRKFAHRAAWTDERRAKFMRTMVARYGIVPRNTAERLSDI
jgi:hypothetical protein